MSYLVKAIKQLHPEAEFTFTEEDYSTIEWHILYGNAPTLAEIEDQILIIKAAEVEDAKLKAEAKTALLTRLGITAEEADLLLA